MASIRCQSISSEAHAQELNAILEKNATLTPFSSGIAEENSRFDLTFTFNDDSKRKRALKIIDGHFQQNDHLYNEAVVDDRFLGITVLHACVDAAIDVVAVHGLGGHAADTWTSTSPRTPTLWLRDLLPKDLHKAARCRVMTFGYDSAILSHSRARIDETATTLLNLLVARRQSSEERCRPVIFMAHSLGGLVVKKALSLSHSQGTYGSIDKHTRTIAFFGTPHRGSAKASWAKTMALIASTVRTTATQNLDLLKRDADALLDLAKAFEPVLRRGHIRILSIYECRKTQLSWWRSVTVVHWSSAVLLLPNEKQIPANAAHREVCRLSGTTDDTYRVLVTEIQNVQSMRVTTPLHPTSITDIVASATSHTLSPDIVETITESSGNIAAVTFPRYIPIDPHSFGRETTLSELRKHLEHRDGSVPPCIALIGPPGVGKTHLTTRLVHQTNMAYDYIFVVEAESAPKLLQSFMGISRMLGLCEGNTDPLLAKDRLLEKLLTTQKRWLVVYDNADEAGTLHGYLPYSGNGSIVLTSRTTNICDGLPVGTIPMRIDGLSEEEAEEFLMTRLGEDKMDQDLCSLARKVALKFLCWPLALRQVSAFITETKTTLKKLWDILSCSREAEDQIFDYKDKASPYEYALAAAWRPILNNLEPHAANLLTVVSLLDPDRIQEELFEMNPSIDDDRQRDQLRARHRMEYLQARAPLLVYDILSVKGESILTLHRTAQSVRLRMITDVARSEAFDTVLHLLAERFPKQILGNHMYHHWDKCGLILPHVLAFDNAFGQWSPRIKEPDIYINMMCDLTWYLWEIGQYNDSLERLKSVEEFCKNTIGLNTLEAARIYVVRGSVYSTLNRYDEAGPLFEKALNIRKLHLSADDQMLANSYMQVGNYFTSQERFEEAIEAHKNVIRIRQKTYSSAPGMMVISWFNLSRSLFFNDSLDLAEEALVAARTCELDLPDGREKDQYACGRLYILGNIYLRRGKLDEALKAHNESYQIRTAIRDPPYSISSSAHKIAHILAQQDRLEEAKVYLREELALIASVPGKAGSKFLRMARAMMKLAEVHRSAGQLDEAGRATDKAWAYHTQGRSKPTHDQTEVDFDKLVPYIHR